ncbi:hypothetical protein TNCV_1346381 [Trichonephila clavipes]|nr:hypothetical protein TNCV_1346381 [Trichonephila clavipes]
MHMYIHKYCGILSSDISPATYDHEKNPTSRNPGVQFEYKRATAEPRQYKVESVGYICDLDGKRKQRENWMTKRRVENREGSLGTATAGSDIVQSARPVFDDFFQHLWPYIGNNTANVVFQMVKRLWLIRIDQ